MKAAPAKTRPRTVFCVTADAHHDVVLAEDVCAGRFTHAGVTLNLGTSPDWLRGPFPLDEEWRIEWSKFYYGLDLAAAFVETGDLKFLQTWERLLLSWIEQVPVEFDPPDVTARRIQNWIYAWNRFEAAGAFPGLTEAFSDQLCDSIAAQLKHLRCNLATERNHRTLELYALYITALSLPELDHDGEILAFAINELHRNLLSDIRADGVQREHSTHYHMVVLRTFVGARINAQIFGLEFPVGFDQHLELACEFAMHAHRPDGAISALSDSDTGSYLDILALAATLFSRSDFLYAATKGKEGTRPHRQYVSFSSSGYFIERSGWGENAVSFADERFLIFDCGPIGDGGHGHYDALSIEIAAGGRPLIIDPGRFTYHEDKLAWRRWFKGTSAHNTVCVDGLDQTTYFPGKPKGPIAEARLLERLSAPKLDLLRGQVTTPAYDAVHTRLIFFVANEYWVVVDQVIGRVLHRYDLRFHLAPEAMNHTRLEDRGNNKIVLAPGVALVLQSKNPPQLEAGWFAPKYGDKVAAPVVNVRAENALAATFFTLVAPMKLNDPVPELLVLDRGPQRISFEVNGVGRSKAERDHVVWSEKAEPFSFGFLRGSARTAWWRESAVERTSVLHACEVEKISFSSHRAMDLAADERPVRWVVWDVLHGLRCDTGETL